MEIVIYRNIEGKFQPEVFKEWQSFASLLGFMLDEHFTKNTNTITVYRRDETAIFTIFHYDSEPHFCLDYLRLKPADPQLVKLMDSLIQYMSLSGEKHAIDESFRKSTFFKEGKVVNADKNDNFSKFDLLLLRETILGFIHLSLDRMVEFRRTGNLKGVAEIKGIISQHHKFLTKLNEQIDAKLKD